MKICECPKSKIIFSKITEPYGGGGLAKCSHMVTPGEGGWPNDHTAWGWPNDHMITSRCRSRFCACLSEKMSKNALKWVLTKNTRRAIIYYML